MDEEVAQFSAIAGVDAATARGFLEMAGGNLEVAVALFFGDGAAAAGGGAPPAPPSDKPDWFELTWGDAEVPQSWSEQRLEFMGPRGGPFGGVGLVQGRNGPCGVLAVINAVLVEQCRALPTWGPDFSATDEHLAAAIVSILRTVSGQADGRPCRIARWSAGASPTSSGIEVAEVPPDELPSSVAALLPQLKAGGGLLLLIYSCVLTKGVPAVASEMSASGGAPPLIVDPHALCSSELLSLMLRGTADGNVGAYGPVGGLKTAWSDGAALPIGMLSLSELEGQGVPVADDLKTPGSPVWVLHGGSHFTILFAAGAPVPMAPDAAVEGAFDLVHFNGLPPAGPRMRTLSLSGGRVAKRAPRDYRRGVGTFYKPVICEDGAEMDSVVQASREDKEQRPSQWRTWRYECVLSLPEEDVQGEARPADMPPPRLYTLPPEGPPPGRPWRCATCYATRFKTMNFGANDAGAETCATCGQRPQDGGFSIWLPFEDLPPRQQRAVTLRHAPRIVSLLQTKWKGADVTWDGGAEDAPAV